MVLLSMVLLSMPLKAASLSAVGGDVCPMRVCSEGAGGAWGRARAGQKGHERDPVQAATREPSTCGHSPMVRSGLLPHEDRASNLVGPVRSEKGLSGGRRPFRAVRHFQRKWATRTPSTLQRG